jgi:hypothetical protein
MVPRPGGMKEMREPAFQEKWKKGPRAIMTVMPGGPQSMGGQLLMWFLYSVLIGIFAAYVTTRALLPGAAYLAVFRFAGTTAFLSYSMALLQNSIWYKRSWAATFRNVFDGLVYACLTGATFACFWPK